MIKDHGVRAIGFPAKTCYYGPMAEKSFNWYRNDPPNAHLYLLDGDLWGLTPGVDFHGSVEAFRVKLHSMTRRHGLRYRSRVWDGLLWVEVYRNTPGDLLTQTQDPEDAPQAP